MEKIISYKDIQRIQQDGWDAFEKGLKETDCPYKKNTDEEQEWMIGYWDSKVCNENLDGDD